ncbi:MAG TPA: hypothetical protein VFV05_21430 [Methylomirabilota bacterium]|nr:hypothetical protein [Methylomirabilota bacterium]
MKRLMAWGALLIGLGTGCATTPPRPSVHAYPAGGQSAGQMSRDTAHCEAWAKQQTGYDPVAETVTGAAVGTLIGGALGAGGGAAVGAASGGSVGRGAATGAVVGGVVGGVAGGAYKYSKSKEGYERAYAACMSGRGYTTGAGATHPAPVAVAPAPTPVVVQPTPVVVQPAPVVVAPPPVVAVAPPPVVVVAPRRVHVPPGHYPPPGQCRIWHAGRPPGHQPRAFPCHQRVAVPPGAFILYNGVAWDGDYDWRRQARQQPGSVPSVIVEISARR